ncbi:MAG: glutathione S-transferase [Myxococcota bacterium]
MKLYEFEAFPNPRRVRIFLAEKGLSVPREQIDVPSGEHRQEPYVTKNPYAAVPALELDDGTMICETVAICRYFEGLNPEPALMGTSAEDRAVVEMWQRRVEQNLFDPFVAFFHHATPGLGALETYQNAEWGQHNRELGIATMKRLDQRLASSRFIAGERFSIADITALAGVDFAAFLDIPVPADHENLHRWHGEVSARPSASA